MTHTAENVPPRPGEVCKRHWSWLCQAGQGECQSETRDDRQGEERP